MLPPYQRQRSIALRPARSGMTMKGAPHRFCRRLAGYPSAENVGGFIDRHRPDRVRQFGGVRRISKKLHSEPNG
jgi:hypothetical protein